jgi:hypothetical protein
MKKIEFDKRVGAERREFHYTLYTPERRSGRDRRIGKIGKAVTWIKNEIEYYNKIWLKSIRF